MCYFIISFYDATYLECHRSSDVLGLASVGTVDCSALQGLQGTCSRLGVPMDNFPHFYVYAQGEKSGDRGTGELLFSGGKEGLSTHIAMPLIAKVYIYIILYYYEVTFNI